MLSIYADLYHFCVVAEEMHITRAAERLHISQQTLSNGVRRLEESCGTPLFVRRPRLRLTAAGERFLAHATGVLEQAEALSVQLDELRGGAHGRLRVGVNQTQSQMTLPPVLREFLRIYPDVRVDVTISKVYDLAKKLRDGDIDLAFRASRKYLGDEFECREVGTQRLCLCVPRPLLEELTTASELQALEASEPASQLDYLLQRGLLQKLPFVLNGPWLSGFARRFFKKRGLAPKTLLEFHDTEMLFTLGYAGLGATFQHQALANWLPRDETGAPVCLVIPLADPGAGIPLLIVSQRGRPLDWPARSFIETAGAVCSQE